MRRVLLAATLTAAACLEVGIIGAGIGGGAVAYYTRMLQGNATNLTVFERNDYIGGRLKHTVIDGQVIELGGDAWSSANEYIVGLVEELGIPTDSTRRRARRLDPVSSSIGVWDGTGFVKVDPLFFGHLISDAALAATQETFLHNLRRNYAERGRDAAIGTPFTHVPVRVTPRHCSDTLVRIFEAASVPRLWARTRAMLPENVEAGLPMKSAAGGGERV